MIEVNLMNQDSNNEKKVCNVNTTYELQEIEFTIWNSRGLKLVSELFVTTQRYQEDLDK